MIAIDSSAIVAILRGEADAEAFLRIIVESDDRCMSAFSVLETAMVLAGRHGDAEVLQHLDRLIARASIEVVPFDATQAQAAREAFLRFGKGRHPAALNIGDCASYALAKLRNVPLLCKGDDFPRTDLVLAARSFHGAPPTGD